MEIVVIIIYVVNIDMLKVHVSNLHLQNFSSAKEIHFAIAVSNIKHLGRIVSSKFSKRILHKYSRKRLYK